MSERSAGGPPLRSALLHLGERPLATRHGLFTLHLFRDLAEARTAMALVRGDIDSREPLLARVHSSCLTSECLMGCDCDCAEQLDRALGAIAAAGRGLVVYLMQEGRGAGLSAKARDRMLVQASGNRLSTFDAYAAMGLPADLRRYDAVASMVALLGVRAPLRLLTNNPAKHAAVARVLAAEKIEVGASIPLSGRRSAYNRDYLHAKRVSGHRLERVDRLASARPPARVESFDPVPLAGDPARLVTATYWLPVRRAADGGADEVREGVGGVGRAGRASAVSWHRASVLVERATGRESVVLARGDWRDPGALPIPAAGDWITMSLVDRLPTERAVGRAALARALAAIEAGGAADPGSVGVVFDDGGA